MIEMPPSGCSDNPFEVFRWQERVVPISGYTPKVPFLSFEDAIPFPRKSHRNDWKAMERIDKGIIEMESGGG